MLSAIARSTANKLRNIPIRSFSTDDIIERKLYEIRTYQLKPEHLMDYLALTGSDAFKARTDASKCNGFFILEMGDVLNLGTHIGSQYWGPVLGPHMAAHMRPSYGAPIWGPHMGAYMGPIWGPHMGQGGPKAIPRRRPNVFKTNLFLL